MASIALIPSFENRSSSLEKDSKLVNGYGEMESEEKFHTMNRNGYSNGVLYAAGAAQGMVYYAGAVRVVVNNLFFTDSSTSTAISAGGLRIDWV